MAIITCLSLLTIIHISPSPSFNRLILKQLWALVCFNMPSYYNICNWLSKLHIGLNNSHLFLLHIFHKPNEIIFKCHNTSLPILPDVRIYSVSWYYIQRISWIFTDYCLSY